MGSAPKGQKIIDPRKRATGLAGFCEGVPWVRYRIFCARFAALRPRKPNPFFLGAAARESPPHRAKIGLGGDPGPAAQGKVILPALYGTTPLLSRRSRYAQAKRSSRALILGS